MPIPEDLTERGRRTIREGLDAARNIAEKLPRVPDRLRNLGTTAETPSPEYVIVEDLPDSLKETYLGVLIWLVHTDDSQIDERELCEIQVLMTQLRCSPEVRQAVRSHLEDPGTLDAETRIARLHELVPDENADTADALKFSLIKDAIRVSRATSNGAAREQPGIRRLAGLLEIDDKQVAFIEEACEQEEQILAGDLSDSRFATATKELAGKASAIGVPISAIYLSGSVTGLSAAGITSGLAALGLGGVLGLSAMVSGIGVAILAGVAVKKGLDWILSRTRRKGAALREWMLQEVLGIHQATIISLAEDISFFGERVASLTARMETNRDAIDTLFREVTLLTRTTGALTRLGERTTDFERDLEAMADSSAP